METRRTARSPGGFVTVDRLVEMGLIRAEEVAELLQACDAAAGTAPAPDLRCGACARPLAPQGGILACAGCGLRVAVAPSGPPTALPPEAQEAARNPANVFGPYILLRELGAGAFGSVHLAFDTKLDRRVALKVLRTTQTMDLARFRREAKLAASLHHPNIAAVYDVGDAGGRTYLAMEYIEGRSLADEPPRLDQAVAWVRDAARALAHAHAQGIVHRDVKPGNVMVDPAGRVVILDFGLARKLDAESLLTQDGEIMGTPAFMSPEQAAGKPADARSDVYSLGATLYMLVTGIPPFTGPQAKVLQRVLEEEPIPPRRIRRDLAPDVETVIQRAMEKEPARRYPSATALAEDLDRVARGEPIAARPASWTYRFRKRVRRNPWAWGVAAVLGGMLVTALVAGAGGLVAVQRRRAADAHAQAGFLAYLAQEDEIAREEADEALSGWRHHPGGHFLRGRLALREYVRRRPLPRAWEYDEIVEVDRPAPERGAERALRAQAQGHLRYVAEGWQVDAAQGLLALFDGRYGEAAERLGRAQEAYPLDWELGFYRAQALYLDRRFDEGWRHISRPLVRRQGFHEVPALAARLLVARALEREVVGEDPADLYEEAEWWAESVRKMSLEAGAGLLAQVRAQRGMYLAGRGDPGAEERLLAAVAASEGDGVEGFLGAGEALAAWGAWCASHGRPGDAESALRRAEASFARARERGAEGASAFYECAGVHAQLYGLLNEHGRQVEAGKENGAWAREAHAAAELSDAVPIQCLEIVVQPIPLAESVRELEALAERTGDPRAWVEASRQQINCVLYGPERGRADRYLRAAKMARRGLEARPGYATGFENRAIAWLDIGWERIDRADGGEAFHRAVKDLTRALAINPMSETAWMNRGLARRSWGDWCARRGLDGGPMYRAALADAQRAVEVNPGNRWTWYRLSEARAALGEPEGALADLDRALDVDPLFSDGLIARGKLRAALGDPGGALADFTRHVEAYPTAARGWEERGRLRLATGDAAGRDDLRRAVELEPGRLDAVRGLLEEEL